VNIETKTLIALNNWRKTITTLNIKNNDSYNIEHEEKFEDTNGMIKRCKTKKSRQYTGQKEEQTIHWPKGRADNTLAKRKRRQYSIVCSSFWPVYCLLFLLVSGLSALPFCQCFVCCSLLFVFCLFFFFVWVFFFLFASSAYTFCIFSLLLLFTSSDYIFGIFSVLLLFTSSDYTFGRTEKIPKI
jgi:hypothetical protein